MLLDASAVAGAVSPPVSPGSTAYTDVNTLLEAHARRRRNKIFIASPDQGSHITFGEFEALTRRFANFLSGEGVRHGDRVSVLSENTIEALVVFWGALRAGVIVNPEAGGYSASIPALPGCHTQGETLDEVRDNLREAAEGWLAVAHEDGLAHEAAGEAP